MLPHVSHVGKDIMLGNRAGKFQVTVGDRASRVAVRLQLALDGHWERFAPED